MYMYVQLHYVESCHSNTVIYTLSTTDIWVYMSARGEIEREGEGEGEGEGERGRGREKGGREKGGREKDTMMYQKLNEL